MNSKKKILKGLSLEELQETLTEIGEKKFRASQIFNWMYNKHVTSFEQMSNLSKDFRQKLNDNFSLLTLTNVTVNQSKTTKTQKFLFETYDIRKIESVIIPDGDRITLCLSTQVGCPLDCKFCATGLMGYKRNLSAGEIVDQYILTSLEIPPQKITNIVYMGMGEPLLNYQGTLNSLKIFTDEKSTGLSRQKITVSTAGIPHRIVDLADSGLRVKLALSLHSCFDEIRNQIMPINEKYSLKELKETIRYYSEQTKTRITFEYTMLKGINDRDEDIKAITKLCRSIPSKINIIPFNSIKHMAPDGISAELEPTEMERINQFTDELRKKNVTVMLRDTQGDDIAAACGQLAIKENV
ncbi:MAG: 23S rRNA (adenine(2503)-C(2))-methyltransferase RlmN [Melioribacteraceae bacterium]|nr:23S rRNA (adenine(2503)-C(2))-methyltransferase RlmN [Melioribacteraceae bacterium]MDD3559354.1 23S rRNA (adenine(2503)-C(2))-methyltransferase RlmN [Melioribacteraceae bacterium]